MGKTTRRCVADALEVGWRHIDTAEWYDNEEEVGAALAARDDSADVFITTKLQNNTGYDATMTSIETSLAKLGVPAIDLYLLHSPLGGAEKRLECWRAVEDAVLAGEIISAGVSNFGVRHLTELLASKPRVLPVVNQIEVHPFNHNREICTFCIDNSIAITAYAPLAAAERMDHPAIQRIAHRHKVSPAQVFLRWGVEKGYAVIPKSSKKKHTVDNASVMTWELNAEDHTELGELDEGLVTDWDPTDAD
jgi:diketogulonate reductase-like aldo/keto reductase